MGMVASQGRLLMLTARKSNIEFRGQSINQERVNLSNNSADLIRGAMEVGAEVDQGALAGIHAQDVELELQLKQLDTEQQAIQTELEAITKVIDKNIESSFKTFA